MKQHFLSLLLKKVPTLCMYSKQDSQGIKPASPTIIQKRGNIFPITSQCKEFTQLSSYPCGHMLFPPSSTPDKSWSPRPHSSVPLLTCVTSTAGCSNSNYICALFIYQNVYVYIIIYMAEISVHWHNHGFLTSLYFPFLCQILNDRRTTSQVPKCKDSLILCNCDLT